MAPNGHDAAFAGWAGAQDNNWAQESDGSGLMKKLIKRLVRPATRRAYQRVNLAIEMAVQDIRPQIAETTQHVRQHDTSIGDVAAQVGAIRSDVDGFRNYVPSILNTISSQNASLRQVRRAELAIQAKEAQLETMVQAATNAITATMSELRATTKTLADQVYRLEQRADAFAEADVNIWDALARTDARIVEAEKRAEFIRREVMFEARYRTTDSDATAGTEAEIINQQRVDDAEHVQLNLGCGHLPLDGFINVDSRRLDGVDIVADVGSLPFGPGEVDRIHSAHMLEHFPLEQLRRVLLPYWFSLLSENGTFTAVVPDAESMIEHYNSGDMSFEDLRLVTFGDQEYEGDFHFTMFSHEQLVELVSDAGFVDAKITASGRPNGVCFEMEVAARRPTSVEKNHG
jgi:predicted SAM-dependent methyltransferase